MHYRENLANKLARINELLAAGDPSQRANLLLARGKIYLWLGQPKEAIQDFSDAIDANNIMTNAYYWRGVGYYRDYNYDNAIADLDIAISRNHNNVEYYSMRAQSLLRVDEPKSALNDLLTALSLDEKNYYILSRIGEIYLYYLHEYDEALRYYKKYYKSRKGLFDIIAFDMGLIWYFKQKYKKADALFSICLDKGLHKSDLDILYFSWLTKIRIQCASHEHPLHTISVKNPAAFSNCILLFFQNAITLKEVWKLLLTIKGPKSLEQSISETSYFLGEYFLAYEDYKKAKFFFTRAVSSGSSPYKSLRLYKAIAQERLSFIE